MKTGLQPNEKIEKINDGLSVIRHPAHLPFSSDALLLAGYLRSGKRAAELGAGTGAVSLLAATRGKYERIDGYEIQESAVEVFARNVSLNGLEKKVFPVCADLRALPAALKGKYDCVFSNPPYMKVGAGRSCVLTEKQIARHETAGDIFDFARAAGELLKTGGEAVFVYRPDRLCDLFAAFEAAGIEPKRMTLVCAAPALAPSVVLVAGKKGGARGLYLTPALFVCGESGEKSADYLYIMEKGAFSEKYVKP